MKDFLTQIRSEYQTVLDTKFWEVYRKRILDLIGTASTDLRTVDPIADATKLARSQGKIEAFNIVLGLPDNIVKDKSK
jgi:hypothetical protein